MCTVWRGPCIAAAAAGPTLLLSPACWLSEASPCPPCLPPLTPEETAPCWGWSTERLERRCKVYWCKLLRIQRGCRTAGLCPVCLQTYLGLGAVERPEVEGCHTHPHQVNLKSILLGAFLSSTFDLEDTKTGPSRGDSASMTAVEVSWETDFSLQTGLL